MRILSIPEQSNRLQISTSDWFRLAFWTSKWPTQAPQLVYSRKSRNVKNAWKFIFYVFHRHLNRLQQIWVIGPTSRIILNFAWSCAHTKGCWFSLEVLRALVCLLFAVDGISVHLSLISVEHFFEISLIISSNIELIGAFSLANSFSFYQI